MHHQNERRPIGDMPLRRHQPGLSVQDVVEEHKLLTFVSYLFGFLLAVLAADAPQALSGGCACGFVLQLQGFRQVVWGAHL